MGSIQHYECPWELDRLFHNNSLYNHGEFTTVLLCRGWTTSTVGSIYGNNLVLPSPLVAEYHGHFRAETDGLHYMDYSISTGTYVNNNLLMPDVKVRLHPGDIISFGVREYYDLSCFIFKVAMRALPDDQAPRRMRLPLVEEYHEPPKIVPNAG